MPCPGKREIPPTPSRPSGTSSSPPSAVEKEKCNQCYGTRRDGSRKRLRPVAGNPVRRRCSRKCKLRAGEPRAAGLDGRTGDPEARPAAKGCPPPRPRLTIEPEALLYEAGAAAL